MRGELKSNHDSFKVRRSISNFWWCSLPRLLLMNVVLSSENAAGFCRLYIETSVFIALCEPESFRQLMTATCRRESMHLDVKDTRSQMCAVSWQAKKIHNEMGQFTVISVEVVLLLLFVLPAEKVLIQPVHSSTARLLLWSAFTDLINPVKVWKSITVTGEWRGWIQRALREVHLCIHLIPLNVCLTCCYLSL